MFCRWEGGDKIWLCSSLGLLGVEKKYLAQKQRSGNIKILQLPPLLETGIHFGFPLPMDWFKVWAHLIWISRSRSPPLNPGLQLTFCKEGILILILYLYIKPQVGEWSHFFFFANLSDIFFPQHPHLNHQITWSHPQWACDLERHVPFPTPLSGLVPHPLRARACEPTALSEEEGSVQIKGRN